VTEQVDRQPRGVSEAATELGCDWHIVNDTVIAYGEALFETDEHRFATVSLLVAPVMPFASLGYNIANRVHGTCPSGIRSLPDFGPIALGVASLDLLKEYQQLSTDQFERVGVVGCGLMGSGIAEVVARSGIDVVVYEVDDGALSNGRNRIERSVKRAVASGKVELADAEETLAHITFSTEIGDLADRQLVLEAVIEDQEVKTQLLHQLDMIVSEPTAIFASNTSSIPIMKLAMATSRPEQVIGLHFFNPVPVMALVETITSLLTSADTAERANSFASNQLGKTVITSPDRAGFVVNALLIPYILSAVRMLESGFATAEHIDIGMVEGCGHPMGPLRLADLIGLDTTQAVADSLYEEFKEPLYSPPPLLSRMVEGGLLGRKSGQGFYAYNH
jgi:3-hydroxybutyryl-CoA dehydrogenase